MTPQELDTWLKSEIAAFPGRVSLLMVDLKRGEALHAVEPDAVVPAASTIKVPILLAAMEAVERKELALSTPVEVPEGAILPDTTVFEPGNRRPAYPLLELLYWMITVSDNTAANVLIDLLGMDAVNGLCRRWGAEHTCLRRKMLDFVAQAAGRENCTTARDQYALYAGLWRRCRGDHPKQCWMLALDTLLRQRCQDAFLRYLNGPSPTVAHKTGGLDHVHHDAGIFQTAWGDYYLGCFTWEGPSLDGEPEQAQFLGRVGRQFYEVYS